MPKRLLNTSTLVGAGLGGATGLAINRLGLGNKSLLSNLLATAAGGTLGGALGYYINKNIEQDVANNAQIEQNKVTAEQKKKEKEKREYIKAVQTERDKGSSDLGSKVKVNLRNGARAVAGKIPKRPQAAKQKAVAAARRKLLQKSLFAARWAD